MPPKSKQEDISPTPCTYGVEPKCIQTSGIVRLPLEILIEILSYFGNPCREIRNTKRLPGAFVKVQPEDVERLTVIRKLTMTCWSLRNIFFPLLWKYVEGCDVRYHRHVRKRLNLDRSAMQNGLYAQCAYLALNPIVCTYVQELAVDLNFEHAPRDLMTKFVDCLTHLPHLWSLDIFSVSDTDRFTSVLERKCARFCSVRRLSIRNEWTNFIGTCPNLESIKFVNGLSKDGGRILSSCGKELGKLNRVSGVDCGYVGQVVEGCPGLQEIHITSVTGLFNGPIIGIKATECLRSLKQLAIVGISLTVNLVHPNGSSTRQHLLYGETTEAALKAWKKHLIQILKDSSSKKRKFLKWGTSTRYRERHTFMIGTVVENGELEVLPETSL